MASDQNQEQYLAGFEGVLIEVSDEPVFELRYSVPGWKCKACGWVVGSRGYPPAHECPTAGIQQHCKHQWGEEQPFAYKQRTDEMVSRECEICKKQELRFVGSGSSGWVGL